MNGASFLMFRRSLMISYGFTLFFFLPPPPFLSLTLLLLVTLASHLGGELAITAGR